MKDPRFALTPRLRLWPAVVIVALQWLLIKGPPLVMEGGFVTFMLMFWTPMIAAVALMVWWLLFSRVGWLDRLLVFAVFIGAGVGAKYLVHWTYEMGFLMWGLPVVTTVWVLWLLATFPLPWRVREVGLVLALLLAWGYQDLIRFDGVDGAFDAESSWRWSTTIEEKYAARKGSTQLPEQSAQVVKLQPGDWPCFRGPARDGKVPGVKIATDWKENPPREVWRHDIGPGWASFAVVDGRLYTQEQVLEEERVVCYDANTGKELWVHKDTTRLKDAVAGAGPRATPTFDDGKIYAFGATGRLNCLDAATGKLIWTRDVAKDSGAKVPTWGFSASPLVHQGLVTVFAGNIDANAEGKGVTAYRADTGEPAWSGGKGTHSYCSLQVSRLGGVEQLLVSSDFGLSAFHPTSGKVLWEHEWQTAGFPRAIQPSVLDDTDVLLGTPMGPGTRRLRLQSEGDGWKQEEVWGTKAISPYYNDLVIHKGHLYGYDGKYFTCVSLEDGKRRWRVEGYGNGQVLLLPEQDLLLVLTEKTGEVVLVRANPESQQELGRFSAIKGKRTWNHPVLAHGKLFVRNGEEVACYQLKEIGLDGK
jgi:outer membrane protein assembly factor BamB